MNQSGVQAVTKRIFRSIVWVLFTTVVPMSPLQAGVIKTGIEKDVFNQEQRVAVVRRVASEFREKYLSKHVADRMASRIEERLSKGDYDGIPDIRAFTVQLEKDMRSISGDRHIKVLPGLVSDFDEDKDLIRRENYGFTAVEVLPGNIGYLDFFQFYSVEDAGSKVVAAMNFLSDCDALIIDLRSNGGGYPELRSLICSYFFDEPTCLMEFRSRNAVVQDWTLPYLPGRRMPDIPVYILIGRNTFSCGEDFAFCMQSLKRAKLIGERTGGGAHDARLWKYPDESITLQIPFSEALDPRTKTNWEGVGVQPDIEVSSGQAFRVAVREAAETVLEREQKNGGDDKRIFLLKWVIGDCESQVSPMKMSRNKLKEYVGEYGTVRIELNCDRLSLQLNGNRSRELAPVAENEFKVIDGSRHGYSYNRVRFVRNGSGNIEGMFFMNQEGRRFPVRERKR